MFALEIIAERLGPDAADVLSEVIEQERDVNVTGLACEKLSEVGEVRHIDALQSLRERIEPDGFLSFVVGQATARLLERVAALHSMSPEA